MIFLLKPILAAILCNHSNHKSEINIRLKHLDISSIKTYKIKCRTDTFIFWLLGGPENPVNARPSFECMFYRRVNMKLIYNNFEHRTKILDPFYRDSVRNNALTPVKEYCNIDYAKTPT